MRLLGLSIVGGFLILPAILVWRIDAGGAPSALFSQYLGSCALISMALAQLLATRAAWLEDAFGPLDRIYVLHKWLGVFALATALGHNSIDAEIRGLGGEGEGLGESLGELSFNGVIAIVLLSIATFIPYHLWRWSHRLTGPVFALGAAHFLLVSRPFALDSALGALLGAASVVGLAAYAYNQIPERLLARRRRFRVTRVDAEGGCASITMAPEGGGIAHRPGQFALFAFGGAGRGESHPFTISSAPRADSALRVTIKPLGDDTKRLAADVSVGDIVDVEGPFGRFERAAAGRGPEIWIAGGVGATPFAAWAQALQNAPSGDGSIHIFVACQDRMSAPHLDAFEALAEDRSNVSLTVCESRSGQRLDVDMIEAAVGDLSTARAYFCGPSGLRDALVGGLTARGLRRLRFHCEAFEFRSGLGFRSASAALAAMASRARSGVRLSSRST